jgi:hypothetical protein
MGVMVSAADRGWVSQRWLAGKITMRVWPRRIKRAHWLVHAGDEWGLTKT